MKRHAIVVRVASLFLLLFSGVNQSSADGDSFYFGIGAHLYGLSRPEILRELDAIADAKLAAVRIDLPWRLVERKRGTLSIPDLWDFIVDNARSRNIEPLVILDYGNSFYDGGNKPISDAAVGAFTGYAAEMADHFKGRVRLFEVWNEWNGPTGKTTPGRPEDYVRLAAAVYPAIKAKIPDSTVIVGATSAQGFQNIVQPNRNIPAWKFFDRLLDLGILRYGDALSIHPYTLFLPPASGATNSAEGFYRYTGAILAHIEKANGGKPFPTFITEVGWPTGKLAVQPFVTESDQSSYILQSAILARTMPSIKGLLWYVLQNGGTGAADMESNFGILYENGEAKPSYKSLQRFLRLVGPATTLQLSLNNGGGRFRMVTTKAAQDMPPAVFLWTVQQAATLTVHVSCTNADAKVTIVHFDTPDRTLPCGASQSLSGSPLAIVGAGLQVSVQ